jgi:WD40 repeat protein
VETGRLSGESPLLTVRYSPDGTLIASGSLDGTVRLWDTSTRALVGSLDVGAAWVWQVAFSPDGTRLAVAADPNGPRDEFNPDREGEVQLWDVASRQRVGVAMTPGKHAVTSVAFSPNGKLIASGSLEERTQLWDAATQERVGKPMDVQDDGAIAMTFSADGTRVVTAGAAVVRFWDVSDQRLALPPLKGHTGGVVGASVDPHSRYLATTSQEGATRVWDARTGAAFGDELTGWRPQSLIPEFPLPAPFVPVRNAFSPDGRFLAVGGIANRPMLWDLSLRTWKTRACTIAGRNLTRAEWATFMTPGAPYRRTCREFPAGPAA